MSEPTTEAGREILASNRRVIEVLRESDFPDMVGEPIEQGALTRLVVMAEAEARASQPLTLDVDRLAAAICNAEAVRSGWSLRYRNFDQLGQAAFRDEAVALAREYAALADPDAT